MNLFYRIFLILIIALGGVFCDAARITERMVDGRPGFDFYRLLQLNGARGSARGKRYFFQSRFYSCNVERDSRKAVVNGVKVDLNFPVRFFGARPYISKFDWVKSFRPLLFPGTLRSHRIATVTIDMGHGGSDPGALGQFSREKDLTLKVGKRLGQFLAANGYRVRYTRYSDVKIPLERIGSIQRTHRSDLFISIHVNSARDRSVSGIETYCLTPAYAPSSGSRKLQRVPQRGNMFDENNLVLAYFVQSQMVKRTGAADRGVKRANFVVLRDINAPGILVEIGFISNRNEERQLNNRIYIDALARGIAEGVIRYRNSMKQK